MKNTFLLVLIWLPFLFLACEKHEKEKVEDLCHVMAESMVPQVVKDLFALRFSAANLTTWFYKESVAFYPYFTTSANIEKLAKFANSGSFIMEQIETHKDDQHDESTEKAGKLKGSC